MNSRHAPWDRIAQGEVIHLKEAGGPLVAKAITGKVHSYDNLTPGQIMSLREQFSSQLGDDADEPATDSSAYWLQKQHCKYAMFIELTQVTPTSRGPVVARSYGQAWFVLGEKPKISQPRVRPKIPKPAAIASPLTDLQVQLTDGALRNRYLRAPAAITPGEVTLLLPQSRTLSTSITVNRKITTRKWAAEFKSLTPGAIATFVPAGRRRYRVSFSNLPCSSHETTHATTSS